MVFLKDIVSPYEFIHRYETEYITYSPFGIHSSLLSDFLSYMRPCIFSVAMAFICDSTMGIQIKSCGSNPKGPATVCYWYMEEVPGQEVSYECLHGPDQNIRPDQSPISQCSPEGTYLQWGDLDNSNMEKFLTFVMGVQVSSDERNLLMNQQQKVKENRKTQLPKDGIIVLRFCDALSKQNILISYIEKPVSARKCFKDKS